MSGGEGRENTLIATLGGVDLSFDRRGSEGRDSDRLVLISLKLHARDSAFGAIYLGRDFRSSSPKRERCHSVRAPLTPNAMAVPAGTDSVYDVP